MNKSLIVVTLTMLLLNNTIMRGNETQQTKPSPGIGVVEAYLQMKDALAADNSEVAASSGAKLENAFKNFNKSTLSADQKKTYDEIAGDAMEHAEHIAGNKGNIEHQREHFDILSKDIYDLVKALGGGQVLYKISDKMFNKGKGAFWLSETKEIRNPYMGKAMLNSGSVQEEIK